ncbi:MAG: 2-phosphosulfolactate phosphatase [Bacteroidetes bacterium]|nr:2-phosphosulfolactate phosphatase [Bacteroidota bacterium]
MKKNLNRSIEICLTPGLFQFRQTRGELITVVVDIFRAGSSMCAALAHGFDKILPVSDVEIARKLKIQNKWMAAGERDGIKLDFADFGNSPVALSKAAPQQHPLILSTSNGTRAIEMAKKAGEIVIGTFNNMDALTSWLQKQDHPILILCSGWMGNLSLEDTLFAGALADNLLASANYKLVNDEALAALELWRIAKTDLNKVMETATHYKRLVQLGALDDIEYALSFNNTNVIPRFDGEFLTNL